MAQVGKINRACLNLFTFLLVAAQLCLNRMCAIGSCSAWWPRHHSLSGSCRHNSSLHRDLKCQGDRDRELTRDSKEQVGNSW